MITTDGQLSHKKFISNQNYHMFKLRIHDREHIDNSFFKSQQYYTMKHDLVRFKPQRDLVVSDRT